MEDRFPTKHTQKKYISVLEPFLKCKFCKQMKLQIIIVSPQGPHQPLHQQPLPDWGCFTNCAPRQGARKIKGWKNDMIWLDGTTSDNGITSVPTLSGQQRGDTQLEMYAPLPPPNCVWNTSWNEFYIIVNLKVCRWCNNIHTLSLFSLNLWIRGDLTLKMKGCVHFHLLSCPKTKCKALPCLIILPKNVQTK